MSETIMSPEMRKMEEDWKRDRLIADKDAVIRERDGEIERLRVQLAGCGVAALGGTSPETICTQDQWGWSPAYQSTLELRIKHDALSKRVAELVEGLRKLEWTPSDKCPACYQMKIDSPLARTVGRSELIDHKPDCWLSKLLREAGE
jgi:hypothetical protein